MAGLRDLVSRLSRRSVVALATSLALVVAATAVLVVARGRDGATTLRAGAPDHGIGMHVSLPDPTTTAAPPETTTTANPLPTAVTTTAGRASPSEAPRTIASDPGGEWRLTLATYPQGECLELHISTYGSGPLLCGSAPAAHGELVGDLVTFSTPSGRAIVAIVEPRLEGWGVTAYRQMFEPVAKDPLAGRSSYAYAVDVTRLSGGPNMTVFFGKGENIVGRTAFAIVEGTVRPGQSLTTTELPYGEWPGFRIAGTTGFYWGGNEELGFYDSTEGRCLLYRRLGGDPEAVLLDICADARAGEAVAYARLLPIPPVMRTSGKSGEILVVMVDGLRVARWECRLPDGAVCGQSQSSGSGFSRTAQLVVDPGSSRQVLGVFPEPLESYGAAKELTIVLFDAEGRTVGQATVPTG